MMLLTLLCSILLNTTTPQETKVDTLPSKSSHIGAQVSVLPGTAISVDRYQKTWMKKHYNMAIDARLNYRSLPKDSDHFAEDYHYPTLSVGMRYHFNHGVTMHKDKADWPGIIETDFDSQMGNIVSVYGAFSRPLLRKNRWEIDYTIIAGTGYSHRKYDKQTNTWKTLNQQLKKGIINIRPTNKAIAKALGMCERQISFYIKNAYLLGLKL